MTRPNTPSFKASGERGLSDFYTRLNVRRPQYNLIETIRPVIEVNWGVFIYKLLEPREGEQKATQ